MKKVIDFISKCNFLLLPIIITVLMLDLRLVHYSSVDDMYMMLIAESYETNAHSAHLVFISFIIGYVLRWLYFLVPAVNWFCVFELAAVNSAFMLVYKLLQKYKASFLPMALLTTLFVYTLNNLTFTAIAFLAAASGLLWAVDHIDGFSKKNIKHFLIAGAMMLLAFMLRWGDTFLCAALIFAPSAVLSVLKKKRRLAVVLSIMVMLTASNYFVIGMEKVYNHIAPEPQLFYDFKEYRSDAYDFGRVTYEEKQEFLEEHGISKNDLLIFNYSMYGDINVYNPDSVKAIAECKDFNDKHITDLKEIWDAFQKSVEESWINLPYLFVAVALIAFVLIKGKRMEVLALLAMVTAAIGYLFFIKRGLPRVFNPIAISAIIGLIWMMVAHKEALIHLPGKASVIRVLKGVTAVALAAAMVWFSYVTITANKDKIVDNTELQTVIAEDTDAVYVAPSWTRNYLLNRNATILRKNFDRIPLLVILGEWYIYSDYWEDYFEQNGISEYEQTPFLYLLEENVKFVSEYENHPDALVTFFEENYQLSVDYEVLGSYCDNKYTVYDFSLTE